jgi:hypothetical protein
MKLARMKMWHPAICLLLALLCLSLAASGSRGDDPKKEPGKPKIDWTDGPATARCDHAVGSVCSGHGGTFAAGTENGE